MHGSNLMAFTCTATDEFADGGNASLAVIYVYSIYIFLFSFDAFISMNLSTGQKRERLRPAHYELFELNYDIYNLQILYMLYVYDIYAGHLAPVDHKMRSSIVGVVSPGFDRSLTGMCQRTSELFHDGPPAVPQGRGWPRKKNAPLTQLRGFHNRSSCQTGKP